MTDFDLENLSDADFERALFESERQDEPALSLTSAWERFSRVAGDFGVQTKGAEDAFAEHRLPGAKGGGGERSGAPASRVRSFWSLGGVALGGAVVGAALATVYFQSFDPGRNSSDEGPATATERQVTPGGARSLEWRPKTDRRLDGSGLSNDAPAAGPGDLEVSTATDPEGSSEATGAPQKTTNVHVPDVAQGRGHVVQAPSDATPDGSLGRMPIRPSRLSEEVKALDAVRRALVLGDHEAALQSLENYVVEFPGGILNQEARVLKIEALLGMGREKEARGLAERFLEQAPDDPQADRVRRLLRQSP